MMGGKILVVARGGMDQKVKHGPVDVDQVVCDALRDSETHRRAHIHTLR